jgi:GntR family transcriptional repressor for pyruvate dehydrogenase complex
MVADILKENILSGKLKEGERLSTQEELARQFGVSRTVMREALRTLSSLGLIESRQGRGTFVRSPDAETLMKPMFHALVLDEVSTRELMETRYYLERIIARLAAKRIDDEQIESLRTLVSSMEQHVKDGNLDAFVKEDLAFHLELANISKNSILRRLTETLREMMFNLVNNVSQIPGTAEQAVELHKKIFHALSQKDPDLADQAMRQHLLDTIHALREEYDFDINI